MGAGGADPGAGRHLRGRLHAHRGRGGRCPLRPDRGPSDAPRAAPARPVRRRRSVDAHNRDGLHHHRGGRRLRLVRRHRAAAGDHRRRDPRCQQQSAGDPADAQRTPAADRGGDGQHCGDDHLGWCAHDHRRAAWPRPDSPWRDGGHQLRHRHGHPPFGYSLFVGASVSRLPVETVASALWPMLGVKLVVLAFVTFVPAVTLWLPSFIR